MSLTSDEKLFELFENASIADNIDEIIIRSLNIKKSVVEQDERESGLRKVLNFGHTIGHGIESSAGMASLYHGECVALGMLHLASPEVRERLIPLLKKAGLPTTSDLSPDAVLAPIVHDKKADGASIRYIYVERIGSFEERCDTIADFIAKRKEEWPR